MEYARASLMTLDPARVGDVVRYVEDEARPVIEAIPGSRGVTLLTIPDLAVIVMESFWISGDAMRESEGAVSPLRKEAVYRGVATVSVERHEVASTTRVARPAAGAGVRLTRVDVEPRRVDEAAAEAEIRALEEYRLEFSTVPKFWTPPHAR